MLDHFFIQSLTELGKLYSFHGKNCLTLAMVCAYKFRLFGRNGNGVCANYGFLKDNAKLGRRKIDDKQGCLLPKSVHI